MSLGNRFGEPAVDTGESSEHMRAMRRYQNNIHIWGGNRPEVGGFLLALLGAPCKHTLDSTGSKHDFLLKGMTEFAILPNLSEVVCRLEPDGVRADWEKVGRDISFAMRRTVASSDKQPA